MVEERLPEEQAHPSRTPAPKPKMTRGKKDKEDMIQGPVKPQKTLPARLVPQVENKKLKLEKEHLKI